MINTTSVDFWFFCLLSYFLVVINLMIRPKLKPTSELMTPHKIGPHVSKKPYIPPKRQNKAARIIGNLTYLKHPRNTEYQKAFFLPLFYPWVHQVYYLCLLYTSDAADEEDSVDLGGRRIIKKK